MARHLDADAWWFLPYRGLWHAENGNVAQTLSHAMYEGGAHEEAEKWTRFSARCSKRQKARTLRTILHSSYDFMGQEGLLGVWSFIACWLIRA
jgi:hypothetical protein